MVDQNLFFIAASVAKFFRFYNSLLVMSCKFLGLLSNLSKPLPISLMYELQDPSSFLEYC